MLSGMSPGLTTRPGLLGVRGPGAAATGACFEAAGAGGSASAHSGLVLHLGHAWSATGGRYLRPRVGGSRGTGGKRATADVVYRVSLYRFINRYTSARVPRLGRPVHGTAGEVDARLGRLPGEQVTLTVARSSGGQDQVRVLLGER